MPNTLKHSFDGVTEGVHEPDGLFDATVGLELFQNMIVTLDFHGMNLILQKGLPASK